MAGRPLDALALIAVGVRSLSMSASGIGPVKAMLCSAEIKPVRDYLLPLLDSPLPSLRSRLWNFGIDHNITLS